MAVDNASDMRLLKEALVQRTMDAIKLGAEWLTADQLIMRFPVTINSVATLSDLVERRRVFSISLGGHEVFATYELSPLGEPLPAVAVILDLFSGHTNVRVAGWLESTNGFLAGRRPRELLESDPCTVLRAARDHIEGPRHG